VLPRVLEFTPERDAEIFAAAPSAPAVFLLRGSDPQAEPYVSKTANLRRRLLRLLGRPEERSRKLNLRDRVARIEYAPTGSDFESTFLLYQVLRQAFPRAYQDRLRLRPAPLVRFHLDNRFPRVSVTIHLTGARAGSQFYGPFPSRAAAEKFANDALDFFKLRRCVEELDPNPSHPGCVYSEMKMCLAPCFQGCTDEQYAAETARVEAFFDTGGQSLVREIAAARDQASAGLEFENAAALHAQLDKLKPLLAQLPEIVHRLDHLAGLMIQPSAEPEAVTFFRLERGCLSAPITFSLKTAPESGKVHSMEARIQEVLGRGAELPHPSQNQARVGHPGACSQQETLEHLAILKRWYYRTAKVGEIFFADDKGELPMRRVVRGVSRVFKGEQVAPDLSETARDYWVNRGKEAELS
jgi:excinuclease ABC subunit C